MLRRLWLVALITLNIIRRNFFGLFLTFFVVFIADGAQVSISTKIVDWNSSRVLEQHRECLIITHSVGIQSKQTVPCANCIQILIDMAWKRQLHYLEVPFATQVNHFEWQRGLLNGLHSCRTLKDYQFFYMVSAFRLDASNAGVDEIAAYFHLFNFKSEYINININSLLLTNLFIQFQDPDMPL